MADTEKFYTIVTERILARYGLTFDFSLKAKMYVQFGSPQPTNQQIKRLC